MSYQKQPTAKKEIIINIRKLVALDIVLHGYRFILAECAFGVVASLGLGIFVLFNFFFNPAHQLFSGMMGVAGVWIGLNYVPLLLYAIALFRRRSAAQEVASEVGQRGIYLKYTLQSAFVVLPLVVPVLSLVQEARKRSYRPA
jgi:hypothetical protein